MPRRKKKSDLPFWWRGQTSCYYVQVDGKQERLSPDLDEAWRLYHELMGGKPAAAAAPPPAAKDEGPLVLDVLEQFLAWAERNKAPLTFEAYRRRLQHFIDSLKAHGALELPASSLRPIHVTRVLTGDASWSDTSKNDIVSACQRAFRWAARQGLVEVNPLVGMEKPGRRDRELAVSPAQYAEIMGAVDDPGFRDLLSFAWESGVRPQEIVRIEARFVRLDERRIVFPVSESKGKRSSRVVYLTPEGEAVLRPLMGRRPSGPLFRSARGAPWNKDSINNAFVRLRRRLGRIAMRAAGVDVPRPPRFVPANYAPDELAAARKAHLAAMAGVKKERKRLALEHGPKLHLGAFRKGYCTEALKNGVDVVTTAHLMGHANAVMVSRVYAKVQQDPAFMAEAARRARGGRTAR
jgi:integrase